MTAASSSSPTLTSRINYFKVFAFFHIDADVNGIDTNPGPGTFRTINLNTGMTVTSGNTIKIAAFTAGFVGTLNNTYFQVNVTEEITGGTNIELKVTVHPDTVIK